MRGEVYRDHWAQSMLKGTSTLTWFLSIDTSDLIEGQKLKDIRCTNCVSTLTRLSFNSIMSHTLFPNHNKIWMKWKFHQKSCKFAKHDKNHATRYLLIIQSFTRESTSSVRVKNPFEFVLETARLAKQDELTFAKHYETPSTHNSWCVLISLFCPSFIVVRE